MKKNDFIFTCAISLRKSHLFLLISLLTLIFLIPFWREYQYGTTFDIFFRMMLFGRSEGFLFTRPFLFFFNLLVLTLIHDALYHLCVSATTLFKRPPININKTLYTLVISSAILALLILEALRSSSTQEALSFALSRAAILTFVFFLFNTIIKTALKKIAPPRHPPTRNSPN